jgi:predicted metal-dependent peptidase
MTEIDYQVLDREMDRTRVKVFMHKSAGFLGPLMSSLNFYWSEDIKTACTNGITLKWNPHWFMTLPKDTRVTVLLHELWHVALLHVLRRGDRDPQIWNWACDVFINNMLCHEGYTFDGTSPWMDDSINRWKSKRSQPIGDYGFALVEEIYDLMVGMGPNLSIDKEYLWGHEEEPEDESSDAPVGDKGDLVEPEESDEGAEHQILNKVVGAAAAAKLAGMDVDGMLGTVETMLKQFLQPKLPWEQLLLQFFTDMFGYDYNWQQRDKRYRDIYLPSLVEDDESALTHLMYFIDVSGSVSDAEVTRCNSEIKYIKESFNPKRLTIVLFDTMIQKTIELYEDDPFEELVVVGRGGTSLVCVRELLLKEKPTAAVIFSDLYCTPMREIETKDRMPIIWIGVNASHSSSVPHGKLIHIRE